MCSPVKDDQREKLHIFSLFSKLSKDWLAYSLQPDSMQPDSLRRSASWAWTPHHPRPPQHNWSPENFGRARKYNTQNIPRLPLWKQLPRCPIWLRCRRERDRPIAEVIVVIVMGQREFGLQAALRNKISLTARPNCSDSEDTSGGCFVWAPRVD